MCKKHIDMPFDMLGQAYQLIPAMHQGKGKIMTIRHVIVLGVCLVSFSTGSLALAAGNTSPASQIHKAGATMICLDRNGTYTDGKWTYTYTITHPGSRSQGARGQLFYDGQPLPPPDNPGDYYDTPLGRFYHAGMPVVLWGEHGWMPAVPHAPAVLICRIRFRMTLFQ